MAALCVGLVLHPGTFASDAAYSVTVSRDLTRLDVEARFAHAASSFTARDRNAAAFVRAVTDCDNESRTARVRGRRLDVASPGTTCLRYRVDLQAAARSRRGTASLGTGIRLVPPAAWLWRPGTRQHADIRVAFDLPTGINVAVPWLKTAANPPTYRIPASPRSGTANAAFGAFLEQRVDVPGATLSVAVLAPDHGVDSDKTARWIAEAARNVSLAYGRFPNPDARIFVIPAGTTRWQTTSPVPFGRVVRDGVEAVELFADLGRPLSDLRADWTTTHEFSHLLLPYVRGRDRWIAEGFAQYYQNVLLARAGTYSREFAWFKILNGLDRGRNSRPDLSPNQAAAGRGGDARMKVYWAGAALMLIADTDLRRRTDGRQSLDTALDRLQRCCLPGAAAWSGPELMSRLDNESGVEVFLPLYRRHASRPGFPDVDALLDALGVSACGETACLAADAELADVRDAIMAASADVAVAR